MSKIYLKESSELFPSITHNYDIYGTLCLIFLYCLRNNQPRWSRVTFGDPLPTSGALGQSRV